ncbi:MAG: hypothetical protein WBO70_00605 [Erysipelotrichaceae bacterium]
MNKQKRIYCGVAVIITTFVLLVLVIFSVLSISSAYTDKKLCDENLKRFDVYAQVNNKINIYLKEIDYLLLNNYNSDKDYWNESIKQIEKLDYVDKIDKESYLINIKEKINDDQYIDVVVKITDPTNNENHLYEIIKYKTIVDKNWVESDKLPVYQQ